MKKINPKKGLNLIVVLALIWAAVIILVSSFSFLFKYFTHPSLGKAIFVVAVFFVVKCKLNNKGEDQEC